jgi:orotate phosphoribosyltransferase
LLRLICAALAQKIEEKLGKNFSDIIFAPAIGGVIVSYKFITNLSPSYIYSSPHYQSYYQVMRLDQQWLFA